ncbi:MAG: hypothetical protein NZM26_01385 [Patescibacteria group bacterium]|nr:hypothetical protein [Patescibacteria group bacterium]
MKWLGFYRKKLQRKRFVRGVSIKDNGGYFSLWCGCGKHLVPNLKIR